MCLYILEGEKIVGGNKQKKNKRKVDYLCIFVFDYKLDSNADYLCIFLFDYKFDSNADYLCIFLFDYKLNSNAVFRLQYHWDIMTEILCLYP